MSNSSIGLKPQSLTVTKLQSEAIYFNEMIKYGYSCFLLPITNQVYRQLCKDYFKSWSTNNNNNDDDDYLNLNDLYVPYPDLSHTDILNGSHITYSIGLISSWIELDNDDIAINEFSFQVFYNEISYANYLGIKTFMLNPPRDIDNIQIFSSNIAKILDLFPSIHISISLPICQDINESSLEFLDIYSTWDTWNSIRITCNYHQNLSVSLGAPKFNIPSAILDRWLLEPIRFYLISSSKFIPNAKNYPVLHKFNQLIIWKLLQFKSLELPTIILHGVDKINLLNQSSSSLIEFDEITKKSTYLSYIQYLISISKNTNFLPYLYSFTLNALGYSNISLNQLSSTLILQSPIEPIAENLENYMYKVFEQDTFKYKQYERAIIKALIDLKKNWSDDSKPHIFFLGPGRGPLIDKFFDALNFLSLSSNDFLITALEKNQNVMIYLNQKNINSWNSQVNLLNMDSRNYKYSNYQLNNQKINMVISELIGSFGCNELMPECIDSISTSDLCDENCIFIPQNLNCYIAPVYCPKYWKLASSKSVDKMYVPMIPEMELISENPEKVWSFTSKVTQSKKSINENTVNSISLSSFKPYNKHNSRKSRISIQIDHKGLIHGLAGFFSSTLYSDIEVNNLPKQPGIEDCVSWLPAFFPIDKPLDLFENQDVSLHIQRICSLNSVWYEWSVECFMYTLVEKPKSNSDFAFTKTPPATPTPESLQFSKVPASLTMSGNSDTSNHTNNNSGKNSQDSPPHHSYDDASLSYMKSHTDNISNTNTANEYKVRLCTGISRVHNLNGTGFKFNLI
jgi:protein arginine N-methyltransferase 5